MSRNRTPSFQSASSVRSVDLVRYSCSYLCWQKLQELGKNLTMDNEKLDNLKQALESDEIRLLLEVQSNAAEIENLKVQNKIRSTKTDVLRRICAKKRLNIAQLKEEQDKRNKRNEGLTKHCKNADYVISNVSEKLRTKQKYLYTFLELRTYRSKMLLSGLKDVFKIEYRDNVHKECNCKRVDTICGLHLPPVNSLKGHMEVEYTAAIGYLVQLLECISKILDYPYRYPMVDRSSTSQIASPRDEKVFHLFGTKWRANRERLDVALSLLGKNIAQLRSDSGLSNPNPYHFLQSIQEMLDTVVRGQGTANFFANPLELVQEPLNGEAKEIVNGEKAIDAEMAPVNGMNDSDLLNELILVKGIEAI